MYPRLASNMLTPCLWFLSTCITGMCLCAQLLFLLSMYSIFLLGRHIYKYKSDKSPSTVNTHGPKDFIPSFGIQHNILKLNST